MREVAPVPAFGWICACSAASQRAFPSQQRARRNARRHYKAGCTAAGEAFNVLDLTDAGQRALWGQTRRAQLERAAKGIFSSTIRDLYPGGPVARQMGCSCPACLRAPEGLALVVREACPLHGAWARAVGADPS